MTDKYSRVAIVTGASSGIGEATARKFVACGYAVVGNGRRADRLNQLETEMGSGFTGVCGDAADPAVIERLFAVAESRYAQSVDIVVVNAGRGLGGSITTADLTQFEEVLKTNVSGALQLMQQAGRRLLALQSDRFPRRAADIVVIGSVVGRHNSPYSAAYGATKFAVHAMTESLRREVASRGVRVTLIEPAIVVSGFQAAAGYDAALVREFQEKFGPLLACDDVANTIHFTVMQPPHVHVSDIMLRPTRQDYP